MMYFDSLHVYCKPVFQMSSAYYVCCIYLNARRTTFIMEASAMNQNQTPFKRSGFYSVIILTH